MVIEYIALYLAILIGGVGLVVMIEMTQGKTEKLDIIIKGIDDVVDGKLDMNV